MRVLILGLAVVAGGCKTFAEDETLPRDGDRFTCNAERVQGLVGQAATQAMGTEAVRTSGARTMRWIQPDNAYTTDFRTDRLNIHLDRQNKVTRINCG